jgi:hypothetical protein
VADQTTNSDRSQDRNGNDDKNRGDRDPTTKPTQEVIKLIADGAVPFPAAEVQSLDDPLVKAVRQLRRRRLIQFIAAAIANDDP